MAAEELLKLFEQNWCERSIFKKDKKKLEEPDILSEEKEAANIERGTSLFSSSADDLFLSPRSVIPIKPTSTKLETILSGKEVNEFRIAEQNRVISEKEEQRKKKQRNVRTRKGKSMSDLEYEELKGFMDLGFVFSEEDQKDSDLVSILPGLQRLVKKDEVEEEEEEDKSVARPYLSEVWDHCGGRKGKKQNIPEIKWKVPVPVSNEVELKDNLKLWAHVVAKTIV